MRTSFGYKNEDLVSLLTSILGESLFASSQFSKDSSSFSLEILVKEGKLQPHVGVRRIRHSCLPRTLTYLQTIAITKEFNAC